LLIALPIVLTGLRSGDFGRTSPLDGAVVFSHFWISVRRVCPAEFGLADVPVAPSLAGGDIGDRFAEPGRTLVGLAGVLTGDDMSHRQQQSY
jgi:hypothetical protein